MSLKEFKKKLLKHPITQGLLARLFSSFIRLVYYSSLRSFIIDEGAKPFMKGDGNAIFAFWHGRMMLLPAICPPNHQMRVLISYHRDGKLISTVISHFGQETVSGSSSKGGQAAVNEMLRALAAGDNISITPDGPRGPVQVAAPGIVAVAKHSGKPILPVTFHATRHKRMRSWDKFMVALPFSRIVFMIGAPIHVANDDEAARLQVEQAMNKLVQQADDFFGL